MPAIGVLQPEKVARKEREFRVLTYCIIYARRQFVAGFLPRNEPAIRGVADPDKSFGDKLLYSRNAEWKCFTFLARLPLVANRREIFDR